MLKGIRNELGDLVLDSWVEEMNVWGERVALYQQYVEGEHRAKMTPEMKKMLNYTDPATEYFRANYCGKVASTMADRMIVSAIEGSDEPATKWADEVMAFSRFDGLQSDVHEGMLGAGTTFVYVDYDNEANKPRLVHEPAWDGDTGMMAVYARDRKTVVAGVKVWWEAGYDKRRVNVYYPDQIKKFTAPDEGDLTPLPGEPEVEWTPGFVPIVPFRNRLNSRRTVGRSEISGTVTLQDALNRALVSMTISGELSAFSNRVAVGFDPPDNLAPGSWVVVSKGPLPKDQQVSCYTMDQATPTPFIAQGQFIIDQIAETTDTPIRSMLGGDSQSGEALKQRETGLLSKVMRAQPKAGNSWEDAMAMAARLEAAFSGKNSHVNARWDCKWKDSQVRNDAAIIANALAVRDAVGEFEFLRLIAPVFGYDEVKITELVKEKQAAEAVQIEALTRSAASAMGPLNIQ